MIFHATKRWHPELFFENLFVRFLAVVLLVYGYYRSYYLYIRYCWLIFRVASTRKSRFQQTIFKKWQTIATIVFFLVGQRFWNKVFQLFQGPARHQLGASWWMAYFEVHFIYTILPFSIYRYSCLCLIYVNNSNLFYILSFQKYMRRSEIYSLLLNKLRK